MLIIHIIYLYYIYYIYIIFIYYIYYTIVIIYIIYKVNKVFQHISKNLKIFFFYGIIYIEVEGFPFSFNFIKDKVASFLLSKNTMARCTDSYAAEARFKSFRLDWFRTFEPGFGFFVCQGWLPFKFIKIPKEKKKETAETLNMLEKRRKSISLLSFALCKLR